MGMFDRPDEWRGKFVLVWSDGKIEPMLFDSVEAGREAWKTHTRASAQTIPVVVRDERADDDLRLRLKAWAEHAVRNGLTTFPVNTVEILKLIGEDVSRALKPQSSEGAL